MGKIYGYLRVSTTKQEINNYKESIIQLKHEKLPDNQNPIIWINETVSGRVDWRKRELGKAFDTMKKGDIIIMGEYSRIGRNFLQSIEFVSECRRKGIILYSTIGDIPYEDTATSNLLLSLNAWKAQTERENLIYRTKIGIQAARTRGSIIGRPKISKLDRDASNVALIQNELNNGVKKKSICAHFNITRPTLNKFIKEHNLSLQIDQ